MSRRTAGVFVVLAILSAGCLATPEAEPASSAIDTPDGPDATDTTNTTNTTAEPWPGFTLTIHDDRDEPRDPRASVPLRTTVRFAAHDGPWPDARLHLVLNLQADTEDDAPVTRNTTIHPTGPNGTLDHTFTLDPAPGVHTVTVTAQWADDHDDHDHTDTRRTATVDFTLLAPMTLHLDAHHAWYDDQKTFDTTHTVGVAPWNSESGLDVITRASDLHGFPVRTTYRADLDSSYVLAVNGTEERWQKVGPATTGTSWSWMIYVDDEKSDRAIDDTRPRTETTLALRYLECDTSGRCQEPPE